MQEWANLALETARVRGASFADARVMDIRLRDLSTKNGQVGTLSESESLGIGVRVLADGSWGFASTDRLTREGVAGLRRARRGHRARFRAGQAPRRRHGARAGLRGHLAESLRQGSVCHSARAPTRSAAGRRPRDARVKGVTVAETSMQFRRIEQWYASTIGSRIHQVKMHSGAGIVAMSFAGDEIQKRSYPTSFGGQHQLGRLRTGRIARSGGPRARASPKKPSRCTRRRHVPKASAPSFSKARSSACRFTSPSAIPSSSIACWAWKRISRA